MNAGERSVNKWLQALTTLMMLSWFAGCSGLPTVPGDTEVADTQSKSKGHSCLNTTIMWADSMVKHTLHPAWTKFEPNGSRCGPTYWFAQETVQF